MSESAARDPLPEACACESCQDAAWPQAKGHDAAQEPEGVDFITMEVDDPTYDRLVQIARSLNCTPAAALEEVIREFKP